MRPILFLDVDGVLNPDFRGAWDDQGGDTLRAQGWVVISNLTMNDRPVWLNLWHGRDLLRAAYETGAELVWATNWHELANKVICQVLGLPQLPVATSPPEPKAVAVTKWAGDRPFVWLDDDETSDIMTACQVAGGAGVLVDPIVGMTKSNLMQAARMLYIVEGRNNRNGNLAANR